MTYKELELIRQLTEVTITLDELNAENKILKDMNEKLMQALRIHDIVERNEQLVCDVCGSNDVIEAPHMGRNCNRCHPL
jgi:citrate lyase beta subunit